MRRMKRASQPTCLRSNQPNIRVGRSTAQAKPDSRAIFSWAALVSVYQSLAADSTTEDDIWIR